MILVTGTAPYNRGRPVVHYGGFAPTGYPTYNNTSIPDATGFNDRADRHQDAGFYASVTGYSAPFDNAGVLNEVLIVDVGGLGGRVYINQESLWTADASSGPTGGFPLGSGESVQLDGPISHIGVVATGGSILFNGVKSYSTDTI